MIRSGSFFDNDPKQQAGACANSRLVNIPAFARWQNLFGAADDPLNLNLLDTPATHLESRMA